MAHKGSVVVFTIKRPAGVALEMSLTKSLHEGEETRKQEIHTGLKT